MNSLMFNLGITQKINWRFAMI